MIFRDERKIGLCIALGCVACGYIDYDYLPAATETSDAEEAEDTEVSLNADVTGVGVGDGSAAGASPTIAAGSPGSGSSAPSPLALSLELTPGDHVMGIALAGDPLPAGYRYALQRSAVTMPVGPADGTAVCVTCALTLTDAGLSSAFTYAYAGFVYDTSDTLLQTVTAGAQPLGTWGSSSSQFAFLKAAAVDIDDNYGSAVALDASGTTLAVGARSESSGASGIGGDPSRNDAPSAGAVYVYTRLGDTWTTPTYLKASNAQAFDQFGYAVALSADGNTLAVTALWEQSSAPGVNGDQSLNDLAVAGAVYVFVRSGSSWVQQAYLKHSHPDDFQEFGRSLALSADGSTLAVGVYADDSGATGINGDASRTDLPVSGAAFFFTRTGSVWSQQAYIKASDSDAGDRFGAHVSLSGDGDTLAVGALWESSSATGVNGDDALDDASSSGAIYVFRRTGTLWAQEAYVKPAARSRSFDWCGSVALSSSGDVLAFGCYGEDSGATGVGGDPLRTDASMSGAVHIVERSGSTWSHAAYIKPSNTGAGDRFGWALDLSDDGNTLLVSADRERSSADAINGDGALDDAEDAGAAYVFVRDGGWSQNAYLKASNSDADDAFGSVVALSGGGAFVAIGAPNEGSSSADNPESASNATANAGAAYLFAR